MYPRWCRVLPVFSVLLAIAGCSADHFGVDQDPEAASGPPRPVTDLAAIDSTTTSITLAWTTPRSDSLHAHPDSLDIRRSPVPITDDNWDGCIEVPGEPPTGFEGMQQVFTVSDLDPGTTLHFGLRTLDEEGRASEVSNDAPATVMAERVVTFADPNFEAIVREALGNPSAPILRSACIDLTVLEGMGRGVRSLNGIAELRHLEFLTLPENEIVSLEPLVSLRYLTHVDVASNAVTDVSPLVGLSELHLLDLRWNDIEDIAPLVANPGLGERDTIYLDGNPLSEESLTTQVPALRDRGATVTWSFDGTPPGRVTDLTLVGVDATSVTLRWSAPGDDGHTGTAHRYDLRYATDLSVLEGWEGASVATGTPAPLPATHPQEAVVSGLTTGVPYVMALRATDEAGNASPMSNVVAVTPFVDVVVVLPDAALDMAIREVLQRPTGDIHRSDLALLRELDLTNRGIHVLSGLEHCERLWALGLRSNDVESVAPLAPLHALLRLDVGDNQIADLTPLSTLTNVEVLVVYRNLLVDLDPLRPLVKLRHLDASINAIESLDPLVPLAALETVYLIRNAIRDVHALVENEGIGTGDVVALDQNPLSTEALEVDIPALEARGVTVSH